MQIGQALPLGLAARPRAAVATATPPPPSGDRVELSTCAPSAVNPWPELKALGLVAGTALVPGPIGPALTASARAGLESVFGRLEKAGAKFYPDNWTRNEPAKVALQFVESRNSQFGNAMGIRIPGYEAVTLESLDDLRRLDGTLGLGESVLTAAEQRQLDYRHELDGAGINLIADRDKPASQVHDGGVLVRLAQGNWLYASVGGASKGVKGPDDLYSLAFFADAGRDLGLERPEWAARLKQAEELGILLHTDKTVDARSLYAFGGDVTKTGLREGLLVSTTAAELERPEALKTRLEAVESAYAGILAPVLEDWKRSDLATQALESAVGPPEDKFPMEERMAVYAALLGATMKGRGHEENQLTSLARLFGAMTSRAEDSFHLARMAEAVIPRLRDQGTAGIKPAQKDLELVLATPGAPQWRDKTLVLMKLTGSADAALEATDLIRMQEPANRPRHEQALRDLAGSLPVGERRHTVQHYRTMLANRLEEDTLEGVSARYLELLRGLAPHDAQGSARDVFATLQARADGRPAQADQLVRSFLSHLVVAPSVEGALRTTVETPLRGGVQEQGNVIVVGGIPIRRKK